MRFWVGRAPAKATTVEVMVTRVGGRHVAFTRKMERHYLFEGRIENLSEAAICYYSCQISCCHP